MSDDEVVLHQLRVKLFDGRTVCMVGVRAPEAEDLVKVLEAMHQCKVLHVDEEHAVEDGFLLVTTIGNLLCRGDLAEDALVFSRVESPNVKVN